MQPKILTLNSNDGLPNDQIHKIASDSYGRLWLPGPSGISFYNGNKIKVFDTQNSLDCPGLRTVTISKNQTIWIGTDQGIEALKIDGSKIKLHLNFNWNFGIAESIFIDDNTIWIGTSYGLIKLENNNFKLNLIASYDLGLVKNIIQKNKENIVAISAKKGVFELSDNQINVLCLDFLNEIYPTSIHKSIDNHFFLGTTNGLYFLNSKFELLQHCTPKTGSYKVTSINSTSNELIVGFNKNIIIYEYNSSSLNETEVIYINSLINDIYIDGIKNIWVATNNNGLRKISNIRKSIFQIDTGFLDAAFSISQSKKGNGILIGGSEYFSLISKLNLNLENQSLFKSIVWDVIEDFNQDSNIWLATQDGLFYTNINNLAKLEHKFSSVISSPNRVLLSRNDELWVGTVSGLFCIKNNTAKEILTNKNEKFGYVYTLTLDVNNRILIGTLGQGLWIEAEEGIKKITNELISENGNTYSIISNNSGRLVIIQEENILLIDENYKTSLILKEFPLGGWTAVWIDDNTIAVGSSDGICIIDVANNKLLHRINLYLDKSEWQFTSSRALFLDAEKNLFCALNNGLYFVDFKNIISKPTPPNVLVNEIIWENTTPILNNNTYELIEGKWSVNISVFSDWYVDEKQIKYRFMLAGFDNGWTELNNGTIKYNSLNTGKYELLVQSHTPLTGYSDPFVLLIFKANYTWNSKINSLRKKIGLFFDLFKSSSFKNNLLLEQNELFKKELQERKIIQNELTQYKEQLEDLVYNRTKELEKEKEKAQKADKSKSTFLANMSHEIRTPLGGIIGLNNILQKTILDENQKDYVEKIENSADHLLQILNNILDISKIESDEIELENIPFSLEKLIFDLKEFAQIKLIDKPTSFIINKNIETQYMLMGDVLRLKQVLINLLSNALKFTEEGTITLYINQLKSIEEKTILHFIIKDTGIGMTPEQIKNLFIAFKQADSSISRKYGGTGLGLNISFKIVELMGGVLHCKSTPKKGTSFSFTIAFDTNDSIDNMLQQPKLINDIVQNSDLELNLENNEINILIAEDNLINQLVIKKTLEFKGYNVTLTNDGQKCVDAFSQNSNFDIIFMDINMPKMNGIEATNYIRKTLKNTTIPIIALTADVTLETQNSIAKYGMNDYLSKPISDEMLQKILEKWLLKK